ncbi:MAG: DUF6624 domain-containing protein [Pseudomonadota bacterium]
MTDLAVRLLALADEDIAVRNRLIDSGELFDGYHPHMAAVHSNNADALTAIIDAHGWPGRTLVGEKGAEAAWLIVQHAIGRPDFQRRCLTLIEASTAAGDMPGFCAAYLSDRIASFEGRPQRYGTDFDWDDNGELSPSALEDAARVDEYRAQVGLGPLAERVQQMRQQAAAEGDRAPEDLPAWRRKRREWAKATGWIQDDD